MYCSSGTQILRLPRSLWHAPFNTSPRPLTPDFSSFAANRLPRCPRLCYQWPMSRRTSISPPTLPHSRASLAFTPFPKWNDPRRFFLSPASHSLVLSEAEGPLTTRHCLSNRHKNTLHPRCSGLVSNSALQYQYSNRKIYEKLELGVTSLKPAISILLIARKTHFVQGAPYASRVPRGIWFTQLQCTS